MSLQGAHITDGGESLIFAFDLFLSVRGKGSLFLFLTLAHWIRSICSCSISPGFFFEAIGLGADSILFPLGQLEKEESSEPKKKNK